MAQRRWNIRDLARASGADPGTVADLVSGKRTPVMKSRTKIEAALGMTPGHLSELLAGRAPDLPTFDDIAHAQLSPETKAVVKAIQALATEMGTLRQLLDERLPAQAASAEEAPARAYPRAARRGKPAPPIDGEPGEGA